MGSRRSRKKKGDRRPRPTLTLNLEGGWRLSLLIMKGTILRTAWSREEQLLNAPYSTKGSGGFSLTLTLFRLWGGSPPLAMPSERPVRLPGNSMIVRKKRSAAGTEETDCR